MRFILIDADPELCKAWVHRFNSYGSVKVVRSDLESGIDCDVLVTPGNCFGIMNGGFDYYVRKYFGYGLQDRVQKHILDEFFGEQPVGTSFLVKTEMDSPALVAYTPTMRIPKQVDPEVAYDATRAAIIACSKLDDPVVAIPGMGTGYGGISPKIAAEMMGAAIDSFSNCPTEFKNEDCHWDHGYEVESRLAKAKEQ